MGLRLGTACSVILLCASQAVGTSRLDARQQDAVLGTSSSSFDWWPYPPGGVSTTDSPIVLVGPSSVSPTISESTSLAGSPSLLTPTSVVTALPTTLNNSSISTATPDPGNVTSASSLTRITALPPASHPSSVTANRARTSSAQGASRFNIVYLAPLFAVLGGILGMLFTWAVCRAVTSRKTRRRRESVLEPGPRYTPPTLFRQAARSQAQHEPVTLQDGHLAANTPQRSKSWLRRAFENAVAPEPDHAPELDAPAEDDPFLVSPAMSERHSARHSEFTARLMSSSTIDRLADGETGSPYGRNRNQSLRRGIFDRLRGPAQSPHVHYERGSTADHDDLESASMRAASKRPAGYRGGHKRENSDMNVEDMRLLSARGTPSRHASLARTGTGATSPGFRIVVEDPNAPDYDPDAPASQLASAPTSPARERASWLSGFPWPGRGEQQDRFTPLPRRRPGSEKRVSPYSSQASSRAVSPSPAHPSAAMARVHPSVLPSSPPLVTSPLLDSSLLFSARAPPGAGPTFGSPSRHARDGQAERDTHQGHSPRRDPPPAATPPRSGRRAGPAESGSPTRAGVRRSPSGRRIARQVANARVQEILSHSWSDRQMAGGSGPGSPNNFGASAAPRSLHVDEMGDALAGSGIEQRLEALRAKERAMV